MFFLCSIRWLPKRKRGKKSQQTWNNSKNYMMPVIVIAFNRSFDS